MVASVSEFPASPWPKSNFVPGEGNPNANILILGEAPGAEEDKHQRPFVGGAGKVLNGILRSAGISREECYLTNVIKYRPPANNISTAQAQAYVQKNIAPLVQEIQRVNPTVIVPVGNTALAALGFHYKITQARGAIFHSPKLGKIIPTYHPAYIMRQRHERETSVRDFLKILKHSKTQLVPTFTENFNISPTVEDVETLARTVQMKVSQGEQVVLGMDLETTYEDSFMDTAIKLFGIAISDSTATVVPFVTQSDQEYWDSDDKLYRAIIALGSILEDPNVTKIFHNSLFDVPVLLNHGFTVVGPIYDTMLGQYLVYHPSKHSLAYLASIYTDFPAWKLTADDKTDKEYRTYNARDCTILKMLKPHVDEDIRSNGVKPVSDVVMNNIIPTAKMMVAGLPFDQDRYTQIRDDLISRIDQTEREVREKAGEPDLNLNSTRQLRALLFDKLKLRSQVKTDSGELSTSKDVLNRLSNRYPNNEIVSKLLEYRTLQKQYDSFIKDIRVSDDGRVHSEFKMHTAVTGRFSSSNPNLQNLPKRSDPKGTIRKMYKTSPGRVIVSADYSQLELVIFAYLSGDEEWINAFETGLDVHYINGESLMGDLYNDDRYRTFAKNFIYGFIYGSQGGEIEKVAPKELINHLSVKEMIDNFAQRHPKMFEYRSNIEKQLNEKRFIRNAFGRKRWFTGNITKADIRAAYNFPIQATAGDIMNMKMPEVDELADSLGNSQLILQLHDAFYIECPESELERACKGLKRIMESTVITPLGYEFNLKADVSYGPSLSDKEMEDFVA